MSKQHSSFFVSVSLQKHLYHARCMLSIWFYIQLQLRLPNAIPVYSLLLPRKLKRQLQELCSCICSRSFIPLCLLGQNPFPQAVPLPWIKSDLSPRGHTMLAEPVGWLCPLVHLSRFSFWWLETVFLGLDQGHVLQESTSVVYLLAHWERGVKGLLICGWKVAGLLIRRCLEVRLKSRGQQFAPQQTGLLCSPYVPVG